MKPRGAVRGFLLLPGGVEGRDRDRSRRARSDAGAGLDRRATRGTRRGDARARGDARERLALARRGGG